MLSLTNGSRTYNFVETKINYFRLNGFTIEVVQLTGQTISINIPSGELMREQIRKIKENFWRQLATIPAVAAGIGSIYFLNVCNVSSHSIDGDIINVTFQSGNTINIDTVSNYEAVNHNDYLSNIWKSVHPDEYLEPKPKYFVDATMSRADIQAVINNAESGDLVVFENGTYNEMYFDFKDGVDLYLGEANFVNNTDLDDRGLFKDTSAVNCHVFGRATFTFGPDNSGWQLYDQFNNSKIYFEFYRVISQHPSFVCAVFHQRKGKLWVKGYSCEGVRLRTYDSDSECQLIDLDIVNAVCTNGDTHFFPSQGLLIGYLDIYVRSGYYEGNGSGAPAILFQFSAEGSNINLMATDFVMKNVENGGLILGGSSFLSHCRLWGCNLYTLGESSVFFEALLAPAIELYNINYTNVEPTNEYQGSLNIDGDYIISRPVDYNTDPDIMGNPSYLSFTDSISGRIVEIEPVSNSSWYEILRSEIPISRSNIIEVNDDIIYDVGYKYRAVSQTGFKTIFTNIYNAEIMPLTNKPIKSKYTIGDVVYFNNNGTIETVTIKGKIVEVSNPNNDSDGVQTNYYLIEEYSIIIGERELFSSKNSLLKTMKGNYLNINVAGASGRIAPNSLDSNTWGSSIDDLSGFDWESFDFTKIDELGLPNTALEIDGVSMFDDCNLTNCILPSNVDTKAEFKAVVGSYDKDTTIWTDGQPIGI